MKSILVDALRQANGDEGDKALSDSGSFEADQEQIESPANDALAQEKNELELMSTTNALIVQDGADNRQNHDAGIAGEESAGGEIEVEAPPVDDEHAVTIVGMMPLPIARRRIPRLARVAPLLCVVCAAAVGGSWILINKVGMSRADLGPVSSTPGSADPAGVTEGDGSLEHRFPFIEIGQPMQDGGTRQ